MIRIFNRKAALAIAGSLALILAPMLATTLAAGPAAAADEPIFSLSITNHKWEPAELTIPANTKVKLVVRNNDNSSEEFDSKSLNREKVIAGKSEATIFIGPLSPGRYPFEGEFHSATAQGVIIAK